MFIRRGTIDDAQAAAPLVAAFRAELKSLKNVAAEEDIRAGAREYREYLRTGYPIYVAEEDSALIGYLVCRVDGDVVWVESIYVRPPFRRSGVAGALFDRAELLAQSLGGDTLYNYVHPNNDKIITFLAKRGYNVLNLIEIRRPYAGETPHAKIRVGGHTFDY